MKSEFIAPLASSAPCPHPPRLFPPVWCIQHCRREPGDPEQLHPEERKLVAAAARRRQEDFAAGRDCARRALAGLGVASAVIGKDPAGVPRWPPGITGSISHCPGRAIAVVAPSDRVLALGVDVECCQKPFSGESLALISTPVELGWLARAPEAQRQREAYARFSAKESVFKCCFVALGWQPDWHDVTVRLELARSRFSALVRMAGEVLLFGHGHLGFEPGYVYSGVWLPAVAAATLSVADGCASTVTNRNRGSLVVEPRYADVASISKRP